MSDYAFNSAMWSFIGFAGGYVVGTVEAVWWRRIHPRRKAK